MLLGPPFGDVVQNRFYERVQRPVDLPRPRVGRHTLRNSLSRRLHDPARLAHGGNHVWEVARALCLRGEGEHALHFLGEAGPVLGEDRLDVLRQLLERGQVEVAVLGQSLDPRQAQHGADREDVRPVQLLEVSTEPCGSRKVRAHDRLDVLAVSSSRSTRRYRSQLWAATP